MISSSGSHGPQLTSMAFIDGENLVFRYQDMVNAGKKANTSRLRHIPDVFIWHQNMGSLQNILRVNYYTSAVGTEEDIDRIRDRIGECEVNALLGRTRLSAHVFKKPSNSKKSKLVDITLTIDALRHAHSEHADRIYVFSGDGDFVPLVREIMRSGKQVVVGALSSGLSSEMRRMADQFLDLDTWLFLPEKPSPQAQL
jgi:uncharacterized LabA/DUF88 family protein